MAKTKKPTKLVIVKSNGVLSELGGISGPILNPQPIELDIINQMINRQRAVYEVNPRNTSEMVRLTLRNLRANNFRKKPETKEVTQVKPLTSYPKVQAPVVTPATVTDTSKDSENKGDFTKK